MSENIMVSIICNAYNHERYIRDALEGFVMQKTNFAYEVLVHDDASTDKTADVIREFEAKYPDIIKPIYQTENQYSKGGVSRFQEPRIKGKYVAVCEGDDYWTDPYKLQKQFDALESHPEIDICAHATINIDAETGENTGVIAPSDKDVIFTVEEVIAGCGGFVGTASLFFRKENYSAHTEFRKFLRLDYTLQIQGALRGGMIYLKDYMSIYRTCVANSWSSRMCADVEKYNKFLKKRNDMLDILDKETDGKYHDVIELRKLKTEFLILLNNAEYKPLFTKKFIPVFKDMTTLNVIKIIVKAIIGFNK